MLCGETILKDYWYIRSHRKGRPRLDRKIVKGRARTFRDERCCFHTDCAETLGGWWGQQSPLLITFTVMTEMQYCRYKPQKSIYRMVNRYELGHLSGLPYIR